jgi:hypothetical protein
MSQIKTISGSMVEVDPAEIKRHAEAMGMVMRHSKMSEHEYHEKAKKHIAELVKHAHKIEDEDDAKAILAHCLNLTDKQADLLFEMMEFAYGWAGSKTN